MTASLEFPRAEALAGRLVTPVPLRPEHSEALYHATHGDPEKERVWQPPPSKDPLFCAILDRALHLAGAILRDKDGLSA